MYASNLSAIRKNKVIIIGISGATCSGKTSLCRKLKTKFPEASIINQDDYFLQEDQLNWCEEVNHPNFEEITALDNESMLKDIRNWQKISLNSDSSFHKLLIIDGFLIFNHESFIPMFNKKFFIDIEEKECYKRRKGRVYNPPDPPHYFEKVVYPMYLKNKREMERMNNDDIVYLDGSHSQEAIFERVVQDINQILL